MTRPIERVLEETLTDLQNEPKIEKKQATRVYVVIDKATQKPIGLIDATSEAKARAHHSDKTVEVRYAEQKDMFAAAKEGVEIEVAGNGEGG